MDAKEMIIHFIQPFAQDKNIGKEYNSRISELPDDCYICLRDQDTLPLRSDWGAQIYQVIEANPNYQIIGCMTNRLRAPYQLYKGKFSNDSDISNHIQIANELWQQNGTKVTDVPGIAGMCMIFHKSVWERIKFEENSIFFDKQFCDKARKLKMNIGVARGVYLFHLYRFGQKDPFGYTGHLR
jgi:hypothetical protein